MSRTYTIHFITPEAAATDSTLKVNADDCNLEYADGSGDSPETPTAFNFTIEPPDKDGNSVSVGWIPFEMVRAIIS
jgi:hypothetical protein